jgi:hypothetical protein
MLLQVISELVFIQDRRLRADVLFIRAQSAIRADGPPSAQVRSPQPKVSAGVDARPLRAARANHVSRMDEKHIRTGNTVTVNTHHRVGVVLYNIKTAAIAEGTI